MLHTDLCMNCQHVQIFMFLDCNGWYRREQLWHHVKRCNVALCDGSGSVRRPLRADQLLSNSSQEMATFLNGMHIGAVYMAIKDNTLIHDLTRMLMSKVINSSNHVNYVRGHVRNLGRVLL